MTNPTISTPQGGQQRALVSVIVVNHNGLDVIPACLDSILESGYSQLELIVVDNGSLDGSLQFISQNYTHDPRFALISNQLNVGFAAGCNMGAQKAKGQYLIFLNSDTEVEKGAVGNLLHALDENAAVAVAQSKLLMLTDRSRIDSSGDFISTIGWPCSRGRLEVDSGQYDHSLEIFSARGAAMIVRKAAFIEAGGFDSDYFMYYEDVDLCWRTRLRGHTIVFVPQSVVYHLGSGLDPGGPRGTTANLHSGLNYIATLVKNLELRNLLVYGSIHMLVHVSTILLYLSERRVREVLGLALALFKAASDFPKLWRKRQYVQRTRVVPDSEILRNVRRVSFADYLRAHVSRRALVKSRALGRAMS